MKKSVELPEKYWFYEENSNKEKALQVLENEVENKNNLSFCFLLGQDLGVYAQQKYQNFEKVFYYFNKGAKNGDAACIYESGIALINGLGVKTNQTKGLRHIKQAAQLNNEMALQFLLNEQFQKQYSFQFTLSKK